MFEDSKISSEQIKDFVARTLDNEIPDGKCSTMCYILSTYLSIYNFQHTIQSGKVKTTTKCINHYIITVGDNKGEIIDPTAQQIDKNYPPVLIGIKPNNYVDFNEIDFNTFFNKWVHPLLHDGAQGQWSEGVSIPLSPEEVKIQNQKIDIISYLRILIRANHFLKKETEILKRKGQPFNSENVDKYFEKVSQIISQNPDKREKLGDNSLIDNFDKILQDNK